MHIGGSNHLGVHLNFQQRDWEVGSSESWRPKSVSSIHWERTRKGYGPCW